MQETKRIDVYFLTLGCGFERESSKHFTCDIGRRVISLDYLLLGHRLQSLYLVELVEYEQLPKARQC